MERLARVFWLAFFCTRLDGTMEKNVLQLLSVISVITIRHQ